MSSIKIQKIGITKLKADAVVNAANSDLCVYCIIELRKVAKQKWTLLHVQIGHNCRALYHDSLERCCA